MPPESQPLKLLAPEGLEAVCLDLLARCFQFHEGKDPAWQEADAVWHPCRARADEFKAPASLPLDLVTERALHCVLSHVFLSPSPIFVNRVNRFSYLV
nr:MAG TPA: hypothetical protein [Caudoviricetes sp.]